MMDSFNYLCCVLCLFFIHVLVCKGNIIDSHETTTIRYTPAMLLNLRPSFDFKIKCNIPNEIKKRKRGKRGGVRERDRKRNRKPFLPRLIIGNVQSVDNKLDELSACVAYLREYRETSLICITETWLNDNTPDSSINLNGFNVVRNDRTVETGKTKGGGVCVYFNENWCHVNNVTVKSKICNENIEILHLVIRPYYLPREFSCIHLFTVYIPPSSNYTPAKDLLTETVNTHLNDSPDCLCIVNGDFNQCRLDSSISLYQQVTCKTRKDSTIDLVYTNVKNGYNSYALPGLGKSDHNMVQLVSKYERQLKKVKVTERKINVWNDSVCDELRACFECTDWNVFIDSSNNDINDLNDVVSEYINFCENNIVKEKKVKCFSNNKPWVTKELKMLLNEKKRSFLKKDKEGKVKLNKLLKVKIRECKSSYKEKIENNFKSNNMKNVWNGVKSVVGYNNKKTEIISEKGKEIEYINDLNAFYARFDSNNHLNNIENLKKELKNQDKEPLKFEIKDVNCIFSNLKINKSQGPDKISGRLLKSCSNQLSFIFTYLFNLSISTTTVPKAWKTSQIIPVPKSTSVKQMNDLRPVALTSIPMKCLERLVLKMLNESCSPHLDPLQFAYKAKRSVEDALLYFTNNLYKHLDIPKCYVRTLFVDFSSAFNTIQPHILIPKLLSMNVNKNIVGWILNFLIERPQFVYTNINNNKCTSSILITNTGAPQGTVLAPFLFSVYTNDCKTIHSNIPIIKYADDTSIQALIKNSVDLEIYKNEIHRFTKWCQDNHLHLNVKKTKEVIFDFRLKNNEHDSVIINGENVEKVSEYKYLGLIIDNKLEWETQSDKVLKSINKRMYFLRKLNLFQIDVKILNLFYQSCIKSIINFSLTVWGGNNKNSENRKINRCLKNAGKLIRFENPDDLQSMYIEQCRRKLDKIIVDNQHPLHSKIERSSRSGRIIHLMTKTQRHFNSFLPYAIRLL